MVTENSRGDRMKKSNSEPNKNSTETVDSRLVKTTELFSTEEYGTSETTASLDDDDDCGKLEISTVTDVKSNISTEITRKSSERGQNNLEIATPVVRYSTTDALETVSSQMISPITGLNTTLETLTSTTTTKAKNKENGNSERPRIYESTEMSIEQRVLTSLANNSTTNHEAIDMETATVADYKSNISTNIKTERVHLRETTAVARSNTSSSRENTTSQMISELTTTPSPNEGYTSSKTRSGSSIPPTTGLNTTLVTRSKNYENTETGFEQSFSTSLANVTVIDHEAINMVKSTATDNESSKTTEMKTASAQETTSSETISDFTNSKTRSSLTIPAIASLNSTLVSLPSIGPTGTENKKNGKLTASKNYQESISTRTTSIRLHNVSTERTESNLFENTSTPATTKNNITLGAAAETTTAVTAEIEKDTDGTTEQEYVVLNGDNELEGEYKRKPQYRFLNSCLDVASETDKFTLIKVSTVIFDENDNIVDTQIQEKIALNFPTPCDNEIINDEKETPESSTGLSKSVLDLGTTAVSTVTTHVSDVEHLMTSKIDTTTTTTTKRKLPVSEATVKSSTKADDIVEMEVSIFMGTSINVKDCELACKDNDDDKKTSTKGTVTETNTENSSVTGLSHSTNKISEKYDKLNSDNEYIHGKSTTMNTTSSLTTDLSLEPLSSSINHSDLTEDYIRSDKAAKTEAFSPTTGLPTLQYNTIVNKNLNSEKRGTHSEQTEKTTTSTKEYEEPIVSSTITNIEGQSVKNVTNVEEEISNAQTIYTSYSSKSQDITTHKIDTLETIAKPELMDGDQYVNHTDNTSGYTTTQIPESSSLKWEARPDSENSDLHNVDQTELSSQRVVGSVILSYTISASINSLNSNIEYNSNRNFDTTTREIHIQTKSPTVENKTQLVAKTEPMPTGTAISYTDTDPGLNTTQFLTESSFLTSDASTERLDTVIHNRNHTELSNEETVLPKISSSTTSSSIQSLSSNIEDYDELNSDTTTLQLDTLETPSTQEYQKSSVEETELAPNDKDISHTDSDVGATFRNNDSETETFQSGGDCSITVHTENNELSSQSVDTKSNKDKSVISAVSHAKLFKSSSLSLPPISDFTGKEITYKNTEINKDDIENCSKPCNTTVPSKVVKRSINNKREIARSEMENVRLNEFTESEFNSSTPIIVLDILNRLSNNNQGIDDSVNINSFEVNDTFKINTEIFLWNNFSSGVKEVEDISKNLFDEYPITMRANTKTTSTTGSPNEVQKLNAPIFVFVISSIVNVTAPSNDLSNLPKGTVTSIKAGGPKLKTITTGLPSNRAIINHASEVPGFLNFVIPKINNFSSISANPTFTREQVDPSSKITMDIRGSSSGALVTKIKECYCVLESPDLSTVTPEKLSKLEEIPIETTPKPATANFGLTTKQHYEPTPRKKRNERKRPLTKQTSKNIKAIRRKPSPRDEEETINLHRRKLLSFIENLYSSDDSLDYYKDEYSNADQLSNTLEKPLTRSRVYNNKEENYHQGQWGSNLNNAIYFPISLKRERSISTSTHYYEKFEWPDESEDEKETIRPNQKVFSKAKEIDVTEKDLKIEFPPKVSVKSSTNYNEKYISPQDIKKDGGSVESKSKNVKNVEKSSTHYYQQLNMPVDLEKLDERGSKTGHTQLSSISSNTPYYREITLYENLENGNAVKTMTVYRNINKNLNNLRINKTYVLKNVDDDDNDNYEKKDTKDREINITEETNFNYQNDEFSTHYYEKFSRPEDFEKYQEGKIISPSSSQTPYYKQFTLYKNTGTNNQENISSTRYDEKFSWPDYLETAGESDGKDVNVNEKFSWPNEIVGSTEANTPYYKQFEAPPELRTISKEYDNTLEENEDDNPTAIKENIYLNDLYKSVVTENTKVAPESHGTRSELLEPALSRSTNIKALNNPPVERNLKIGVEKGSTNTIMDITNLEAESEKDYADTEEYVDERIQFENRTTNSKVVNSEKYSEEYDENEEFKQKNEGPPKTTKKYSSTYSSEKIDKADSIETPNKNLNKITNAPEESILADSTSLESTLLQSSIKSSFSSQTNSKIWSHSLPLLLSELATNSKLTESKTTESNIKGYNVTSENQIEESKTTRDSKESTNAGSSTLDETYLEGVSKNTNMSKSETTENSVLDEADTKRKEILENTEGQIEKGSRKTITKSEINVNENFSVQVTDAGFEATHREPDRENEDFIDSQSTQSVESQASSEEIQQTESTTKRTSKNLDISDMPEGPKYSSKPHKLSTATEKSNFNNINSVTSLFRNTSTNNMKSNKYNTNQESNTLTVKESEERDREESRTRETQIQRVHSESGTFISDKTRANTFSAIGEHLAQTTSEALLVSSTKIFPSSTGTVRNLTESTKQRTESETIQADLKTSFFESKSKHTFSPKETITGLLGEEALLHMETPDKHIFSDYVATFEDNVRIISQVNGKETEFGDKKGLTIPLTGYTKENEYDETTKTIQVITQLNNNVKVKPNQRNKATSSGFATQTGMGHQLGTGLDNKESAGNYKHANNNNNNNKDADSVKTNSQTENLAKLQATKSTKSFAESPKSESDNTAHGTQRSNAISAERSSKVETSSEGPAPDFTKPANDTGELEPASTGSGTLIITEGTTEYHKLQTKSEPSFKESVHEEESTLTIHLPANKTTIEGTFNANQKHDLRNGDSLPTAKVSEVSDLLKEFDSTKHSSLKIESSTSYLKLRTKSDSSFEVTVNEEESTMAFRLPGDNKESTLCDFCQHVKTTDESKPQLNETAADNKIFTENVGISEKLEPEDNISSVSILTLTTAPLSTERSSTLETSRKGQPPDFTKRVNDTGELEPASTDSRTLILTEGSTEYPKLQTESEPSFKESVHEEESTLGIHLPANKIESTICDYCQHVKTTIEDTFDANQKHDLKNGVSLPTGKVSEVSGILKEFDSTKHSSLKIESSTSYLKLRTKSDSSFEATINEEESTMAFHLPGDNTESTLCDFCQHVKTTDKSKPQLNKTAADNKIFTDNVGISEKLVPEDNLSSGPILTRTTAPLIDRRQTEQETSSFVPIQEDDTDLLFHVSSNENKSTLCEYCKHIETTMSNNQQILSGDQDYRSNKQSSEPGKTDKYPELQINTKESLTKGSEDFEVTTKKEAIKYETSKFEIETKTRQSGTTAKSVTPQITPEGQIVVEPESSEKVGTTDEHLEEHTLENAEGSASPVKTSALNKKIKANNKHPEEQTGAGTIATRISSEKGEATDADRQEPRVEDVLASTVETIEATKEQTTKQTVEGATESASSVAFHKSSENVKTIKEDSEEHTNKNLESNFISVKTSESSKMGPATDEHSEEQTVEGIEKIKRPANATKSSEKLEAINEYSKKHTIEYIESRTKTVETSEATDEHADIDFDGSGKNSEDQTLKGLDESTSPATESPENVQASDGISEEHTFKVVEGSVVPVETSVSSHRVEGTKHLGEHAVGVVETTDKELGGQTVTSTASSESSETDDATKIHIKEHTDESAEVSEGPVNATKSSENYKATSAVSEEHRVQNAESIASCECSKNVEGTNKYPEEHTSADVEVGTGHESYEKFKKTDGKAEKQKVIVLEEHTVENVVERTGLVTSHTFSKKVDTIDEHLEEHTVEYVETGENFVETVEFSKRAKVTDKHSGEQTVKGAKESEFEATISDETSDNPKSAETTSERSEQLIDDNVRETLRTAKKEKQSEDQTVGGAKEIGGTSVTSVKGIKTSETSEISNFSENWEATDNRSKEYTIEDVEENSIAAKTTEPLKKVGQTDKNPEEDTFDNIEALSQDKAFGNHRKAETTNGPAGKLTVDGAKESTHLVETDKLSEDQTAKGVKDSEDTVATQNSSKKAEATDDSLKEHAAKDIEASLNPEENAVKGDEVSAAPVEAPHTSQNLETSVSPVKTPEYSEKLQGKDNYSKLRTVEYVEESLSSHNIITTAEMPEEHSVKGGKKIADLNETSESPESVEETLAPIATSDSFELVEGTKSSEAQAPEGAETTDKYLEEQTVKSVEENTDNVTTNKFSENVKASDESTGHDVKTSAAPVKISDFSERVEITEKHLEEYAVENVKESSSPIRTPNLKNGGTTDESPQHHKFENSEASNHDEASGYPKEDETTNDPPGRLTVEGVKQSSGHVETNKHPEEQTAKGEKGSGGTVATHSYSEATDESSKTHAVQDLEASLNPEENAGYTKTAELTDKHLEKLTVGGVKESSVPGEIHKPSVNVESEDKYSEQIVEASTSPSETPGSSEMIEATEKHLEEQSVKDEEENSGTATTHTSSENVKAANEATDEDVKISAGPVEMSGFSEKVEATEHYTSENVNESSSSVKTPVLKNVGAMDQTPEEHTFENTDTSNHDEASGYLNKSETTNEPSKELTVEGLKQSSGPVEINKHTEDQTAKDEKENGGTVATRNSSEETKATEHAVQDIEATSNPEEGAEYTKKSESTDKPFEQLTGENVRESSVPGEIHTLSGKVESADKYLEQTVQAFVTHESSEKVEATEKHVEEQTVKGEEENVGTVITHKFSENRKANEATDEDEKTSAGPVEIYDFSKKVEATEKESQEYTVENVKESSSPVKTSVLKNVGATDERTEEHTFENTDTSNIDETSGYSKEAETTSEPSRELTDEAVKQSSGPVEINKHTEDQTAKNGKESGGTVATRNSSEKAKATEHAVQVFEATSYPEENAEYTKKTESTDKPFEQLTGEDVKESSVPGEIHTLSGKVESADKYLEQTVEAFVTHESSEKVEATEKHVEEQTVKGEDENVGTVITHKFSENRKANEATDEDEKTSAGPVEIYDFSKKVEATEKESEEYTVENVKESSSPVKTSVLKNVGATDERTEEHTFENTDTSNIDETSGYPKEAETTSEPSRELTDEAVKQSSGPVEINKHTEDQTAKNGKESGGTVATRNSSEKAKATEHAVQVFEATSYPEENAEYTKKTESTDKLFEQLTGEDVKESSVPGEIHTLSGKVESGDKYLEQTGEASTSPFVTPESSEKVKSTEKHVEEQTVKGEKENAGTVTTHKFSEKGKATNEATDEDKKTSAGPVEISDFSKKVEATEKDPEGYTVENVKESSSPVKTSALLKDVGATDEMPKEHTFENTEASNHDEASGYPKKAVTTNKYSGKVTIEGVNQSSGRVVTNKHSENQTAKGETESGDLEKDSVENVASVSPVETPKYSKKLEGADKYLEEHTVQDVEKKIGTTSVKATTQIPEQHIVKGVEEIAGQNVTSESPKNVVSVTSSKSSKNVSSTEEEQTVNVSASPIKIPEFSENEKATEEHFKEQTVKGIEELMSTFTTSEVSKKVRTTDKPSEEYSIKEREESSSHSSHVKTLLPLKTVGTMDENSEEQIVNGIGKTEGPVETSHSSENIHATDVDSEEQGVERDAETTGPVNSSDFPEKIQATTNATAEAPAVPLEEIEGTVETSQPLNSNEPTASVSPFEVKPQTEHDLESNISDNEEVVTNVFHLPDKNNATPCEYCNHVQTTTKSHDGEGETTGPAETFHSSEAIHATDVYSEEQGVEGDAETTVPVNSSEFLENIQATNATSEEPVAVTEEIEGTVETSQTIDIDEKPTSRDIQASANPVQVTGEQIFKDVEKIAGPERKGNLSQETNPTTLQTEKTREIVDIKSKNLTDTQTIISTKIDEISKTFDTLASEKHIESISTKLSQIEKTTGIEESSLAKSNPPQSTEIIKLENDSALITAEVQESSKHDKTKANTKTIGILTSTIIFLNSVTESQTSKTSDENYDNTEKPNSSEVKPQTEHETESNVSDKEEVLTNVFHLPGKNNATPCEYCNHVETTTESHKMSTSLTKSLPGTSNKIATTKSQNTNPTQTSETKHKGPEKNTNKNKISTESDIEEEGDSTQKVNKKTHIEAADVTEGSDATRVKAKTSDLTQVKKIKEEDAKTTNGHIGGKTESKINKPLVIVVNTYGRKMDEFNKTQLEPLVNISLSDVNLKYVDLRNLSHKNIDTTKSATVNVPMPIEEITKCNKSDYDQRDNCFCDIENYLSSVTHHVEKVPNTECAKFMKFKNGFLISNQVTPLKRKRRSLLYFDNMNAKTEIIQYSSIQDLFLQEALHLPASGINMFALPGSSIQIQCHSKTRRTATHDGGISSERSEWTFTPHDEENGQRLPETGSVLYLHGVTMKNSGNYSCSKNGISQDHELEVISFPVYEVTMNIFYKINETCSIQSGDVLYAYLPKFVGPLLCGNEKELCKISMHMPRCLFEEEESYLNVTIIAAIEPTAKFLSNIQDKNCDINCKLKVYASAVKIAYHNAEMLEKLSVHSRLTGADAQDFEPTVNEKHASPVATNPPKIIISCPGGYGIEKEKQSVCVVCPKQTYSAENEAFCKVCPTGQYQPKMGSISCIPCTSPVDDKMCLRMLYSNTHMFKLYVGMAFGLVLLIVVAILLWSNSAHDENGTARTTRYFEGSLRHRAMLTRKNMDVEKGELQALLSDKSNVKRTRSSVPPQVPPPDF